MKKIILFLIINILIVGGVHSEEDKNIIIITHQKSPIDNKISSDTLKDIFTGKIKYITKIKLLPANMKEKELYETFLKKYISMSPTAYKNYWVKKVFAEGGNAPKIVEDNDVMIKYITENPGAVGYIWEKSLDKKNENIKQIEIYKEK